MSEIKQINTGVAELLALKVPEGATGFHFNYEAGFKDRVSYMPKNGLHFVETSRLPTGKWTPLGLSTELTEEQCREVVEKSVYIDDALGRTEYYRDYGKDSIEESTLFTAKEAFASLMQANECYTENPFRNPDATNVLGASPSGSDYEVLDERRDQWREAESNTGTWLLLKRLS